PVDHVCILSSYTWHSIGTKKPRSCDRGFLSGLNPKLFSSGFGCCGGLGGLFFSAFLGLVARFALLRVVAGFALHNAGGVEETQNAVGRLGANANPVLGALGVQNNALFVVLGEQRVEGADLLDEAAVARRTGVSDDDLVERALLGAT